MDSKESGGNVREAVKDGENSPLFTRVASPELEYSYPDPPDDDQIGLQLEDLEDDGYFIFQGGEICKVTLKGLVKAQETDGGCTIEDLGVLPINDTAEQHPSCSTDALQKEEPIASCSKTKNKSDPGTYTYSRHFNDLPQEIILRIFSFLRPRELCRFVAPVCVRWLQFSRDPTLWDRITYEEFKDVSDELFMKVLTSWCPMLKVIDFKCRATLENEDFQTIFSKCPQIESISFAFCSQICDKTLHILARNCKHVHDINLEGTSIKDASLWALIGLPLKYVNASHCTLLSDDGLIFLAKNFHDLVGINLDGVQWITHDALKVLTEYHSSTLTDVFLDGTDLTDESVQLLSKCANVRTFSLSFCDNLTDGCLKWIKKFQHLKSLQLKKGLNFSNERILDLLNEFHIGNKLNMHGLTYLNLTECSSLSDECLRCIADGCPNLLYLILSWCREVTDDGINFIMDSCHQLVELCLCGLHKLSDVPLARIPKEMKQLRFLDVEDCNRVSNHLLDDLVFENLDLLVWNSYGQRMKAEDCWNQPWVPCFP